MQGMKILGGRAYLEDTSMARYWWEGYSASTPAAPLRFRRPDREVSRSLVWHSPVVAAIAELDDAIVLVRKKTGPSGIRGFSFLTF